MSDKSDASELLDLAVEYNILSSKKEKKFRRDLQVSHLYISSPMLTYAYAC